MKILFLCFGLMLVGHAKTETIVFGAGCFWGVEKHFEHLDGVLSAKSGYAGGSFKNPSYEEVLKHRNNSDIINHTEVVEVLYDDTKISTQAVLKSFWELHDPTQGDRQGHDRGNNYRSAVYFTNDKQKDLALKTQEIYQVLLHKAGYGKITTEIKKLEKFYPAEAYHQDYLTKNPRGYCPSHQTGVKFVGDIPHHDSSQKKIMPLGGKEIIVIESKHCPFCTKFKKDVVQKYRGSIPLRVATEDMLKGFTIDTKISGTPTLLFFKNAKEVYAHIGYMDEKAFYKRLGAFKLGKDSEGYDVAFKQKTDGRFCKQYERFKHTGDGVFIDKVSGDIIFDTRDRFDSGSGWLSFFQAVPDATVEKEDNAFGMKRVEIIAKKSGAHLGHVFDDAPGGKRRFCINATVLEFVPRDKLKK